MNESRRPSAVHVPALDGIRGLAILLVIPHNSSLMDGTAYHGLGYVIKEVVLFGWAGVQLFFVLSGFLITGFLLDCQRTTNYFSSFYARRALRILPLYYGVLAVMFLVLAPLGWLPTRALQEAHHQIWLWIFLSNWTDSLDMEVWGFTHYWSLAVEEQFYLLWPIALYRMQPRRVVSLCVGIAFAALVARVIMRAAGCPIDYLYELTICRMDALALGAAAAAALRDPAWEERLRDFLPHAPLFGLVIFVVGALVTHGYQRTGNATLTYGQSLLAIAFVLTVLAAAQSTPARASWLTRSLRIGPLRSVGRYSYGMYVFHYPIHKWIGLKLIGTLASGPSALTAISYCAAITATSYCLAWLSYNWYERRFLDLKRHFAPRSAPRAVAI